MARSRRQASNENSFKCPECGRTFGRAAALGAHRRRAHGVAGTSAGRRASSRPAPARNARGGGGGVNRDALLRALFPNGVPPREDVLRAVNQWLDEAERLAGVK